MATEHAPQSPSAQPSFEPVKPRARKNSSNVVFGETSVARTGLPFNVNSNALLMPLINQLIRRQRQELCELGTLGHVAEKLRGPGVMTGVKTRIADFLFDACHFLRQDLVVKLRGYLAPVRQGGVVLQPLPDLG